ncbi:MAG TPA: hypothetical protein VFW05_07430 [Verrucomicrobiae bacterium]|nr:hypothetical protein [Verrucomicrobiae bacterium]
MEAKALKVADAPDIGSFETFWQELLSVLFARSEEIVANNVELLNLDWGLGELIRGRTVERIFGSRRTGLVTFFTSSGLASTARDRLQQQFYSDYSSRAILESNGCRK